MDLTISKVYQTKKNPAIVILMVATIHQNGHPLGMLYQLLY